MHTVGLRNVSDELLHVGSDSVSDVSAAGSVCNIGRGDPSSTSHHIVNRVLWAFCVYLEAVSVMPQLRVMQNTRVCMDSKSKVERLFNVPRSDQ